MWVDRGCALLTIVGDGCTDGEHKRAGGKQPFATELCHHRFCGEAGLSRSDNLFQLGREHSVIFPGAERQQPTQSSLLLPPGSMSGRHNTLSCVFSLRNDIHYQRLELDIQHHKLQDHRVHGSSFLLSRSIFALLRQCNPIHGDRAS